MKGLRGVAALGLLACLVAGAAHAAPVSVPKSLMSMPCDTPDEQGQCPQQAMYTVAKDSETTDSLGGNSRQELSSLDKAQAKLWHLTDNDWKRFKELKASFRQYWSPNSDPLETLGAHAQSEEELRRFARLKARVEFERVEKEFAFQRAYDAAFKEMYAGIPRVNYQGRSSYVDLLAPGPKRLIFFAGIDCQDCRPRLAKLLSQTGAAPLDIYLVGTGGDDGKARGWAQKMGIPPDQAKSGKVTINHERGELSQLKLSGSALPFAVLRMANGQLKAYSTDKAN